MLISVEISLKTKYSDVENLMEEAEKLDPDNDALQISIDSYRRTGNPPAIPAKIVIACS
jgi:hypothetical protein